MLVTHDIKVAAKSERVLFLFDGKIAGEFSGTTSDGNGDTLRDREERLAAWLAELGF